MNARWLLTEDEHLVNLDCIHDIAVDVDAGGVATVEASSPDSIYILHRERLPEDRARKLLRNLVTALHGDRLVIEIRELER